MHTLVPIQSRTGPLAQAIWELFLFRFHTAVHFACRQQSHPVFNPIHFTVVAVFVVGVLLERPVVRIQSSEVDEILWTGGNVSFRKEEVKVFPQLVEGCYTYQQSVDFAIGSVCTFFSVFLRFPRTPLTLEFGVDRSALLYTHPQTLDILSDIIHRR